LCICLFSAGNEIRIQYASESVWLKARTGIPDIIADMLVENKASKQVSSLLCIVPQMLLDNDLKGECFSEATIELPDEKVGGATQSIYYPEMVGNRAVLRLTVPDPTDTVKDITYTGTYCMGNEVRLQTTGQEERALMNYGRFGVFEIILAKPIEPNEQRWLRLKISPYSGPREQRGKIDQIVDYVTDQLHLHYHVASPMVVFKEIAQHLAQLRRVAQSDTSDRRYKTEVLLHIANLIESLVDRGTGLSGTKVTINDWRTRFFLYPMDSFTSIQTDGAVRAVGSQPTFSDGGSKRHAYYEWATGDKQVHSLSPGTQGYFSIRFATKYTPLLYRPVALYAFLGVILSVIGIYLALGCG
jgi:hypothetical protein